MKFFVIPPLKHLELMHEGTAGYFCLAQLYKQYPEYRAFFRDRAAEKKFVLLDNGAGDNARVTLNELLEITKDLMPTEVVAPDIVFRSHETLDGTFSFTEQLKRLGIRNHLRVMGVPQGSSKKEWLGCYKSMLYDSEIDSIGLSKISVPWCFLEKQDDQGIAEARNVCIDELESGMLIEKDLHFLGGGEPWEYKRYTHIPQARSTDSCILVWSAMNKMFIGDPNFQRFKTANDYFYMKMNKRQHDLAMTNIRWFKDQMSAI